MTNQQYYELYIASDEEVTTIISRMHATQEHFIALIIPQRALVLQSIINLRLLVREAAKREKELMIVTQDEPGIALAERIGIPVALLSVWQKDHAHHDFSQNKEVQQHGGGTSAEENMPDELIGSQDFFTHDAERPEYDAPTQEDIAKRAVEQQTEVIDSSMAEVPVIEKGARTSMDVQRPRQMDVRRRVEDVPTESTRMPEQHDVEEEFYTTIDDEGEESPQFFPDKNVATPQQSTQKDSEVIETFRDHWDDEKQQKKLHGYDNDDAVLSHETFFDRAQQLLHKDTAHSSRREKNGLYHHEVDTTTHYGKFIAFGTFVVVAILLLTTLPYTTITVHVAEQNVSEDVRITAEVGVTDVDMERRTMGLRKIEKDIVREVQVPATGASQQEQQKARGTITIYNAYSAQAQPLVATTRFRAEDGTLFRLVEGVSVPGTTVVDGATVPGTIDVLVVADQPGPAGNIAPTSFSIPGFAGGPKATAIYAKSTVAMAGGSDGSETLATVTEADLQSAKTAAEKDLDVFITTELQKLLRPGEEMLLGDAWTSEIVRSEPNVTLGAASADVTHTVTTHVRALIVHEQSVEGIARHALHQKDSSVDRAGVTYEFQYKKSETDFDREQLIISLTATAKNTGVIDDITFRENIANKTHDDIADFIREEYPTVTNISLAAMPPWPPFISNRISARLWMTRVVIE